MKTVEECHAVALKELCNGNFITPNYVRVFQSALALCLYSTYLYVWTDNSNTAFVVDFNILDKLGLHNISLFLKDFTVF